MRVAVGAERIAKKEPNLTAGAVGIVADVTVEGARGRTAVSSVELNAVATVVGIVVVREATVEVARAVVDTTSVGATEIEEKAVIESLERITGRKLADAFMKVAGQVTSLAVASVVWAARSSGAGVDADVVGRVTS